MTPTLFSLQLGTNLNTSKTIKLIEARIIFLQATTLNKLKLANKSAVKSALLEERTEIEFLNNGSNLILYYYASQERPTLQFAVNAFRVFLNDSTNCTFINTKNFDITNLQSSCALKGIESSNHLFKFVYADAGATDSQLYLGISCGFTITYHAPEVFMNKVAYNYLYLAVDKDFNSFSEGCFFMKEQSVTNGESILVLYSSPKCSEEGARLRVLCRSEASQSVIYFGAKTERFGGKSSRAFCNKGYATMPDTDLEALKVLRLEHYDADIDGIWVSIAVVGVNANNTIGVNWTLAIPVSNPNESSNMCSCKCCDHIFNIEKIGKAILSQFGGNNGDPETKRIGNERSESEF